MPAAGQVMRVLVPPRSLRRSLLMGSTALLGLAGGSAFLPAAVHGEPIYTLKTTCSIEGAAPVPCEVTALNEEGATRYSHSIGDRTTTVRVTGSPVRMALWDGTSQQWQSLNQVAARFSTNTICFNGRDLCVVNPNYLNSIREERDNLQGRDLVMVHFGDDGRVDATCYDDACSLILQ